MKAKYEMKEGLCPMCNSDDLVYEANELLDNIIRYPYACGNCDFVGAEDSTLTFDSHIALDPKEGIILLENPTTEKQPT